MTTDADVNAAYSALRDQWRAGMIRFPAFAGEPCAGQREHMKRKALQLAAFLLARKFCRTEAEAWIDAHEFVRRADWEAGAALRIVYTYDA